MADQNTPSIQLPDMEKPSNELYIKEAGIYSDVKVENAEYIPSKPPKKEGKEPSKPYAQLTLRTNGGYVIKPMIFPPPASEADIPYLGDHYENNVVTRKNTPQEQLAIEWMNTGYIFAQLGVALGNTFEVVKNAIYPFLGRADFEGMLKTFNAYFMAGKVRKNINMKIVFNHNDTKKTSFLGLPRAGQKNMIFEQFIPGQPPRLQFTDYEEKKGMTTIRYKMNSQKTNQVDLSDIHQQQPSNDWKPDTGNEPGTAANGAPLPLF